MANPSQNDPKSDEKLVYGDHLLGLAGHNVQSLQPVAQILYFDAPLLSQDFMLMELDAHLLQEIEAGNTLHIRGADDDSAVICTASRSYNVREAVSSNSLLLSAEDTTTHTKENEENDPKGERRGEIRTIVALCNSYMETTPVTRKCIAKLTEVLKEGALIDNEEDANNVEGMPIGDILEVIQMSEAQLLAELNAMPVCAISSSESVHKFAYLSPVYRSHLLSHVTDAFDDVTVDPVLRCDAFDAALLIKKLYQMHGVREEVGRSIVNMWAEPIDDSTQHRLHAARLCAAQAQVLLRHTTCMKYNDLMEVWQQCVPEGLEVKEEYLLVGFGVTGVGLVQSSVLKGKSVQYLPADGLPDNVEDRLSALFATRAHWSHTALSAYLEEIVVNKKEIGTLITKNCRSAMVKGQKVFTAR